MRRLLLLLLAACSGPPQGWTECTFGSECEGELRCEYTRTVETNVCVTEAIRHCVKRCANDGDCVGERSALGATETCRLDCAGDRFCDGVR